MSLLIIFIVILYSMMIGVSYYAYDKYLNMKDKELQIIAAIFWAFTLVPIMLYVLMRRI